MIRPYLKLLILAFVSHGHCARANDIDFESQIRPLLKAHCVKCHGPTKQAGGLRLNARAFALRGGDSGPIVVAANSGKSLLWQRLVSHDDNERMPPEGQPLPTAEQERFKKWIDAGANWPETEEDRAAAQDQRLEHWAWQPLREYTPPTSALSHDSIKNEVDLFLIAKLNELGLTYSPEADRRTLMRRLSFDLLGLPPTPEQIREFEADRDPQAYEHLVDRLLDSPHYGERAAQHWLDIAHYADTHGFERDQIREHAWRYRDWVIEAFNRDMRFDDFVRKQIAGDAINSNDPQSVIATGFLSAGPWDFVGQAETPSPILKRLARADDLDDMVTQVMAATMGMTINCARCHDHKLDPITQREYYAMCAVFAGTKRGNRAISTAAEQQGNDTKAALIKEIHELKQQIGALTAKGWSLADIVGGGNGLGTGKIGAGIDPGSGQVIQEPRGFLEGAMTGRFVQSPLPIVDGVAIPDGQSTELVISSTGLKAVGLPRTSGKAWDAIRNGPVNSQFSTKLDGVDYTDGVHKLLSLHANSLITFDLSELPVIPSQPDATKLLRSLRGGVGYFGQTPKAGASVFILIDGHTQFTREAIGRGDGLLTIDLAIPATARFLTLVATDNGNDISHDQVCFADVRIEPAGETATENAKEVEAQAAMLKQQLDQLTMRLNSLPDVDRVYAVQSETPPKVSLLARGDTEQPLEEVQPGAVKCIAGLKNFELAESASDFQRRQQLANWITDDSNPLMPRVIVNRLWQQHFGVGLVATPSDFGMGGAAPSHPELLDWLAVEFKKRHYSIKAMHRLICNSAAYRQQSTLKFDSAAHNQAIAIDASNRWLWRQNPRKLDAESLRDAVLAVSGQLDPKMFGPGFRDFDYKEEYAPVYTYVTKADQSLLRRSIYRFRVRTTPNPLLMVLDCPNPANLTPTRNTTTTALQSLALLNHEFLLQQAESFATRLEQTDRDALSQVKHAWQLAFGREPLANEREAALQLIAKHGLTTFCRYLLNANEFVSID